MSMAELIALASVRSGKTRGKLAEEMGFPEQSKLTRLAKGITIANASEVVFLAQQAKVDPLEALAEIEALQHPELANVWRDVRAVVKS